MFYLLKLNIKSLFIKQRLVVFLFFLSMLISMLTLFFCFGEIVTAVYETNNYNTENRTFKLDLPKEYDSFSAYKFSLESIINQYREIENIKFILRDGVTVSYYNGSDYNVSFGTYFIDEDIPQIVIGTLLETSAEIGSYYTIDSQNYLIVGKRFLIDYNEINYAGISDLTSLSTICVVFSDIPSNRIKIEMTDILKNTFPNAVVNAPQEYNPLTEYTNNDKLYIVIGLVLMSFLTMSFLYRYLLIKRRNNYAILQICGCKKITACVIFLGELIFLTIVPFMVAALIFKFALERILMNQWTYTIQLTLVHFITIFILSLAALILIFVPIILKYIIKTPKELKYMHIK